jgi:hypothetical protein
MGDEIDRAILRNKIIPSSALEKLTKAEGGLVLPEADGEWSRGFPQ